MDVDGQGRLDLNEISPLVMYLVTEFLGHPIEADEVENVVRKRDVYIGGTTC